MFENITQLQGFLGVVFKFSGIAISVLYSLFALVMIKQVSSMKKVLLTDSPGLLDTASYIQLIIALALFVFSLFIL